MIIINQLIRILLRWAICGLWLLLAVQSFTQIINTNLTVGPSHDGSSVIEICISMTNTFPNDFDIMSLDEQVIVIQFTQDDIDSDLSELPMCLDPRDFEFSPESIHFRINQNMLVTNRSDRKDFEMSWRFKENFALGPGQTIELACIRNTILDGSCGDLKAFIDCYGTQFTKYSNGNVIPTSEDACPELILPSCDNTQEDEVLELTCKEEGGNEVVVSWEEVEEMLDYEVRINGENWENTGGASEFTIGNLGQGTSLFIQVRGLNNCGPNYSNSITCRTTFIESMEEIVYIPNAFSPNGDGVNDQFQVFPAQGYRVEEYSIFNRYGNLLYRYINDGMLQVVVWDGNTTDEVIDTGILVCSVTLSDQNGNEYHRWGDVSVIR